MNFVCMYCVHTFHYEYTFVDAGSVYLLQDLWCLLHPPPVPQSFQYGSQESNKDGDEDKAAETREAKEGRESREANNSNSF